MDFQTDTRDRRTQEVRIGVDDREIVVFHKATFFIHNLVGKVEGIDYHLKLAAPWTGFRHRLLQSDQELATAKKRGRMQAFDPDWPLTRHRLVEFDLDVHGRAHLLTPEDRHGLTYVLREGDDERGRLVMRSFEAQHEGAWQADLQAPEDWSVPLAAFVAWLAREGREGMAG